MLLAVLIFLYIVLYWLSCPIIDVIEIEGMWEEHEDQNIKKIEKYFY